MEALLSTDTVGDWLRERGVLPEGTEVRAQELAGGVSGVVLDVEADGWSGVVKQSLERFRVPDEWLVDRERTIAEAEALELAAKVLPGGVPRVLHLDREACVLVIERAPGDRVNWKARLLDGEADLRSPVAWGGCWRPCTPAPATWPRCRPGSATPHCSSSSASTPTTGR